jgi:phospholipase C
MRSNKMRDTIRKSLLSTAAMFAVATITSIGPVAADKDDQGTNPNKLKTATPIKHLVVIFNENRSFDHYFGTYPNALNPEGEPRFEPAKNTPTDINNLLSNPAADQQSEPEPWQWRRCFEPLPPRPHAGQHQVAEPRLYAGAARL